MPQPARQASRKIGGANNQQRKSKLCMLTPEAIFVGLFVIWLIVGVQFYRFGVDTPQQQQEYDAVKGGSIRANVESSIGGGGGGGSSSKSGGDGAADDFPDHYLTFSTACSASQTWQSFMLFYYAYKVSQPGYVIRIASGCSEEQQKELKEFHEKTISKLSPNFSVHFTPDFSRVSGDNYKYYNKPFGIKHWLEKGMKYKEREKELEDAIIMVLDPDMILLRPLTYDFTESNVIIHKSKKGVPKIKKVMHGQPWASLYAFGNGPFRQDMKHIFANHTDSPALRATSEEQSNNYPGGPPYMATGRDMFNIVNSWCELVVRVHDVYKHLLGEMFGWSLAAAHLGLPHTLAESFMISAVDIGSGEGWDLIDALGQDEICEFSTLKEKEDKLPYVMHYCQNYWLGKWFAGKYRLDSDFLSCDKPLLLEPPQDIGLKYDFYIKPGGNPYGEKVKLHTATIKREEFMVCGMIKRLNDAATWFKEQTCEPGTANLEKSFIFHNSLDPDNNKGGEKKAKW